MNICTASAIYTLMIQAFFLISSALLHTCNMSCLCPIYDIKCSDAERYGNSKL